MKLFSITYDLKQPGKNYTELYDKIKGFAGEGKWQHPLESCWIVKVEETVTVDSVTQMLRSAMDQNDSIFVVDISGQSYQGWLPRSFWVWMRS